MKRYYGPHDNCEITVAHNHINPSNDIKYAIYLVLVEDTNEAYERLADGGVDTIETVKLDLTYDEALELIQEIAWG